MLARWKKTITGLPSIFANDAPPKRHEKKTHDAEMDKLYAKIGKLTTQFEWLKMACEFYAPECRSLVDWGNDRALSVTAQAELLFVPRNSLYYHPVHLNA